ncbi:MAG TPA: GtrA family protein [Candidatus Saccharimonadales bacterium]|nr:GtrA family protein [Candidatus Saccharimonadales bacterium]
MRHVKHHLLGLYRHHFVRYIFVGGSTFAMDFLLLVFLHGVLGINVIIGATISYWTSIIYNFLMNRFWTFQATENTQLGRHMALYGALLGCNYLFTITFIGVTGHFGVRYTVAKVLAVAIQMSWTYLVYQRYIFKTQPDGTNASTTATTSKA